MTDEKLDRLKKVLAKIESYSKYERYFGELDEVFYRRCFVFLYLRSC